MEWLNILSIAVCFVLVINRIRKQDRELSRSLSLLSEQIRRLEKYTGLNKMPADTNLDSVASISYRIFELEKVTGLVELPADAEANTVKNG